MNGPLAVDGRPLVGGVTLGGWESEAAPATWPGGGPACPDAGIWPGGGGPIRRGGIPATAAPGGGRALLLLFPGGRFGFPPPRETDCRTNLLGPGGRALENGPGFGFALGKGPGFEFEFGKGPGFGCGVIGVASASRPGKK